MRNHQLNTRIEEKAYKTLKELSIRLHTTKGHLTEKAIYLLKDHFDHIEKTVDKDKAGDLYLMLLSKSMDRYGDLYKKLAK